jgi:hypothetical protein
MLKCVCFNARSLKNKFTELHYVLYSDLNEVDIVCITETWLTNTVSNSMLDPRNLFNIFRYDRSSDKVGGGVIVFAKKYIAAVQIDLPTSFASIECVCIDLLCNVGSSIRLLTIYRPGGRSSDDARVMTNLTECLNELCPLESTCVITGDLNCADIDWLNNSPCNDALQRLFIDTISELGLLQYVEQPTRGKTILDIVLCNDPLLIVDVTVGMPFSTSDHCIVEFIINNSFSDLCPAKNINSLAKPPISFFVWDKANWNDFKTFLNKTDWDHLLSGCEDTEQCWYNFHSVLQYGINAFVPKIDQKSDKKRMNCKLKYPRKMKKLLNKKAILWRKYRKKRTKKRLNAFNIIAKRCKLILEQIETEKENRVLRSTDLGKFYRFVNSKLSSKSGVAPLKYDHGGFAFSSIEKAELLNNYFASICTIDNNVLPIMKHNMPADNLLELIDFNEHDIHTILMKLKSSFASGPDGIPPIFYKKLADPLTEPLAKFFRCIFSFCVLPNIWKTALVTPVYKKGPSSSVGNYRPISLTCVVCKVFESVIKNKIQEFLLQNCSMTDAQHGFVAGHSTCTNLLESLNDWTISLKNGNCTRVAHVDFVRAFDSVCHSKLLLKLQHAGVSGMLLKIIESFLRGRSQCVVIDGISSNAVNITSGVPQGSVLGPLLFLIYINDLADVFPENVVSKYFADDAKLYTEIESGNDVDELQYSLDLLADWAVKWQLSVSFLKCSTIDIAVGKKIQAYCENNIEGNVLANNTEVTDLGVMFDSSLTFTPHITKMVRKAKQRIFLLFRSFRSRNTGLLLTAYKSFVLPLLDYCSSVWSPGHLYNIKAVESVQHLFTSRLPGLKFTPYLDRLKILNLPSLELRRLRADIVLCYKILNGMTAGPPERYGLTLANVNTRGHNMKLYQEQTCIDIRKNFFCNRVIKPWNALPQEVIDANSVLSFKRGLLRCDLSAFLKQKVDVIQ